MNMALAVAAGLFLDRLLGEPARWHPLVGFGTLAQRLERALNRPQSARHRNMLRGACAVILMLLPWVALAYYLRRLAPAALVDALALYCALGARALSEHAEAVARPLLQGNLAEARGRLAYLVSRDTAQLDAPAVAHATVESTLENGNDAVFAAVFWCVVAGAPGVVLYRLANTLDAMWGYRNTRFNDFGWGAARLDDVLNYLPARLTALSYALLGHTGTALRCWRTQAPAWSSPNAGPVMAAGAGSLGIALGGAASYEGVIETRPPLGCGRPAQIQDIARSLRLVRRSLYLWLALIVLGDFLVH